MHIKQEILQKLIEHAAKDLPNEACGYLAGKDGVVTLHFELTNTDHSPEHFSFDPQEQFNVMKQVRNEGMEIIANYHSHPSTPARPSEEDIRLAFDSSISYVIISLAEDIPSVKSFIIKDSIVKHEEINIVQ